MPLERERAARGRGTPRTARLGGKEGRGLAGATLWSPGTLRPANARHAPCVRAFAVGGERSEVGQHDARSFAPGGALTYTDDWRIEVRVSAPARDCRPGVGQAWGWSGGASRRGARLSATDRQCETTGDVSVGLRSRTTRRPQAGQYIGIRAIEKVA